MIPATVRSALLPLVRQLSGLDAEIRQSDQAILALAKTDEMARRLMTVPGIGPITASALAASIQDISTFSGSREFAAFLGSRHGKTPPAERNGWDASPRWVTDICASCS
ncbi:transposase [Mesorhizobium sp. M0011]